MAFRIDQNAAASMPTPASVATPGYFHEGDPATGNPATPMSADWLNMTQEEILTVVEAGGLTPDKTDPTQLYQALQILFGSGDTITMIDNNTASLSGGAAASFTAVDLSAYIPAGAKAVILKVVIQGQDGSRETGVFLRGGDQSNAVVSAYFNTPGGSGTNKLHQQVVVAVDSSRQIKYQIPTSGATVDIYVQGYIV